MKAKRTGSSTRSSKPAGQSKNTKTPRKKQSTSHSGFGDSSRNRPSSKQRSNTASRGKTQKAQQTKGQGTRINKYLADAGIGARRAVEEFITAGMVKVNGKVVTDLSTRIQLEDFVTVKGEPVTDRRFLVYFLLNKPKDVITTASDELGRTTVLDLIRSKYRIFPVGRLDRNTTGALLITNDGELAYRLTHPKYEIKREYKVGLDKDIDLRDARNISYGIELEDGKTGACEVFVDPKDHSIVNLILAEGKNREVRRIFEALGYDVKKLDRKRFATLSTSGLRRGEHRQLTKSEVRALRDMVGLDRAF
ncbi:MAG: rRNA pseudouridine synthase [Bacteroidetes bacterium]|nr:rRNA pseudouridine synthase [bacterium]NBP63465.1 rRNA pseudouridine synthase [Bacteroidota bacterium]